MFQGKSTDNDRLNRDFGFDPASITYLILSHAHIDHCGLIPRLVREGFTGKIFCTPSTLELCELILMDSAQIQQTQAAKVPQLLDDLKSPHISFLTKYKLPLAPFVIAYTILTRGARG